jgi:hypothetical protein
MTESELDKTSKHLESRVNAYGYDFVTVVGNWRGEGYDEPVPEPSLFVIGSNVLRDTRFAYRIKELMRYYKQESVILSFLSSVSDEPLAYYWDGLRYNRAGVMTVDNVEEMVRDYYEARGYCGWTELKNEKFVYAEPKKVKRSWGAKNDSNEGRANYKALMASALRYRYAGDQGVEDLFADYDRWEKELS